MKSVKQNVILQSIDQRRITVKSKQNSLLLNRLRKLHCASDSYKKKRPSVAYAADLARSSVYINNMYTILRCQIILHMAWCIKRSN